MTLVIDEVSRQVAAASSEAAAPRPGLSAEGELGEGRLVGVGHHSTFSPAALWSKTLDGVRLDIPSGGHCYSLRSETDG